MSSDNCYVCFDQETKDNKYMNVKACLCKGTIKVHWSCYLELLNISKKCSICNLKYQLDIDVTRTDDNNSKEVPSHILQYLNSDEPTKKAIAKFLLNLYREHSICLVKTVCYKKFYSINGTLIKEGELINDIPNGKWKFYYESGCLKEKGIYDNGLRHGYFKFYYDGSGHIKEEGNYKNNKKDGFWKTYHETCKLQLECNYINDMKDGSYKEYDYDGRILEEGIYIICGRSNFTSNQTSYEYYDSGKIKKITKITGGIQSIRKEKHFNEEGILSHEIWQRGFSLAFDKWIYWKTYHPNGNLKSKGPLKYVNDKIKRHGPTKYYYESGGIEEEGWLINGERHGHWKTYYESGTLKDEGPYDHGIFNGYWKEYYESGALKEEGPYVNGTGNGHWKIYYESGALKEEGPYVNGIASGIWKEYTYCKEEMIITYVNYD